MSNPAVAFLQQTDVTDPATLFRAYAHYLLRSADARRLPVSLDLIRKRHRFQRHAVAMPSRGFLVGATVFVNSDDRLVVQRFSEAHEFMETLFVALQSESSPRIPMTEEKQKESWCEQGAAELLMPATLFFPLAQEMGISLATARSLSDRCGTSLTAAARRMLDADVEPCILVLAKEGYKRNQIAPARAGANGDEPQPELRVWRWWAAPQVKAFVCPNESISRDTSIYQTLRGGRAGQVRRGVDALDLEYIKGAYRTESMRVTMKDEPVVIALIHL